MQNKYTCRVREERETESSLDPWLGSTGNGELHLGDLLDEPGTHSNRNDVRCLIVGKEPHRVERL